MHWHAIRQSNGYAENQGLPSSTHLHQLDGNSMSAEAEPETHETSPPIPEGDDACDLRSNPDELALHTVDSRDSSFGLVAAIDDRFVPFVGEAYTRASLNVRMEHLAGDRGFVSESRGPGTVPYEYVDPLDPPSPPTRIGERPTEYYRPESPASSDDGSTTYTDKPWLKVSIPWAPANNLTPYAYHRALMNRIDDAALLPGHRYDIKAYTPTFLYDCLVLPGSLANVRGKVRDQACRSPVASCGTDRVFTGLRRRHDLPNDTRSSAWLWRLPLAPQPRAVHPPVHTARGLRSGHGGLRSIQANAAQHPRVLPRELQTHQSRGRV